MKVAYICGTCGGFIVENRDLARKPKGCPHCRKGLTPPETWR